MFQIGKTIVSEDIIEKDFVCNLSACHGACCVDGDAGAPLNDAETKILEDIYEKVKPFLRKDNKALALNIKLHFYNHQHARHFLSNQFRHV